MDNDDLRHGNETIHKNGMIHSNFIRDAMLAIALLKLNEIPNTVHQLLKNSMKA